MVSQVRQLIASDDGILASPELLEGEFDDNQPIDRALSLAPSLGWRSALLQAYGDGLFLRYVTDESRLLLLSLLPIEPSSVMLEIGPGYGQMTIELSKHCASVDAVEPDIKQARFCQIRATQEGRNNVRLFATGSSGELPFEGGIYGGVIMNLVLEWCGIREHGRDHQEIQQRYLNEIHRVLEPGGFLFISTKNRYALRLLLGGRDEHMSDMRFGSPLPRWLGKVLAGGVRQPGHIHSRSQLLRMLRAAGFDNIQGFVALPDMRWPKYYVPEGLPIGSDLLASLSPRLGKIAKLIPQGAFKYVSPGLTFLAIK